MGGLNAPAQAITARGAIDSEGKVSRSVPIEPARPRLGRDQGGDVWVHHDVAQSNPNAIELEVLKIRRARLYKYVSREPVPRQNRRSLQPDLA